MEYQCEIIEQPAQTTLVVRTRTAVGNLPTVLGGPYHAILNNLGETDGKCIGAPYVAYYNMDMDDLDIEIGFPVSKTLPGKGEVQTGEIPAGKQATCLYVGPYNKIEPAYGALMKYIQEKGLTPTGVAYEFYLNDPGETPENELQTKIAFPLR
jgi:effector-binding domain-containing protein